MLLLDRRGLIAYHRAQAGGPFLFTADDAGRAEFCRYLRAYPREWSVQLVVDGSEERFRTEPLPRIRGADRRRLLQRSRQRLFPGALYTRMERQGADHRVVLYSCLSNTEAIQQWSELLQRHRIPLAGIHSPPWLLGRLLDRLGLQADCLLLLSMHAFGGLRQSCFVRGNLRLSRHSSLPAGNMASTAEAILRELDKMLRFLRSELPEFRGAASPRLAILAADPLIEVLHQDLPTDLQMDPLSFTTLAGRLRLPDFADCSDCDAFLARVLFREDPGPGYATPRETLSLRRLRRDHTLWVGGLCCLLAGLLCTALLLLQAEQLHLDQAALSRLQAKVHTRLQNLPENLPANTPDTVPRQGLQPTLSAAQMQVALARAATLRDRQRSPWKLWAQIGAGLQAEPKLKLERLEWSADVQAIGGASGVSQETLQAGPASRGSQAILQLSLLVQDETLEGALSAIRRFSAQLRKQGVHVELLHSPLQPGSAHTDFILRVWSEAHV